MSDLQTPLTEIEVAGLLNAVKPVPHLSILVRRLAFERDRLTEREGLLREAAACPPDSDLLSWVRMLADAWEKQQAAEAAGGES